MRTQCPVCRQPIKPANVAEHVARAHPRLPRREYRELQIPRPRRRGTGKAWMPVAVAIVILVAVALTLGSNLSRQGRIGTDHTFYDLGEVPQAVVDHSFRLWNEGKADLLIQTVWTSCGCTSAHLVIRGEQSPHFGMHDNPRWQGRLAPGEESVLVVLYDATYHDDRYVGERSVFLRTTDPGAPEFEFRIRVAEV